jgi:hypothetical protein
LYEVGNFLGSKENDCFNAIEMTNLRDCYSRLLDFSNMNILKALRFFCSDCGFWLPYSQEKSSRLAEVFPGLFARQ